MIAKEIAQGSKPEFLEAEDGLLHSTIDFVFPKVI